MLGGAGPKSLYSPAQRPHTFMSTWLSWSHTRLPSLGRLLLPSALGQNFAVWIDFKNLIKNLLRWETPSSAWEWVVYPAGPCKRLYREVQTGHIPSRQAGGGRGGHRGGTASGEPACCCEVQWPQGMDRCLLSDLAVLVEGGASPGCWLLPAPAARHGAGTGLVGILGAGGALPQAVLLAAPSRPQWKGVQEGAGQFPGCLGAAEWISRPWGPVCHQPPLSRRRGAAGLSLPWNSRRIQRVAPSPHRAEGCGWEITNPSSFGFLSVQKYPGLLAL